MITEHNYPKIWLLEVIMPKGSRWLNEKWQPVKNEEQAQCFLHPDDAKRYAERGNYKVVEIELPFRLEYEMTKAGVVWQPQRYYRTSEVAQAGFERYLKDAHGTWAGDHTFRLVDVRNGGVIAQAQPNTVYAGQERITSSEAALSTPAHSPAQDGER